MYINIPLLGSWSLSSMFGLAALSPAEVNTMIGNYYLFIITDFTIILFFNLLIIWLQMGWIHYACSNSNYNFICIFECTIVNLVTDYTYKAIYNE